MKYKIFNLTKDNLFLDYVEVADKYFARLKGLLGRTTLESGQGLVIRPCNSIHTVGMKFPIDVAFIDKNDKIVFIMEEIPEGKFSPIVKGAKYVVETRAGEIKDKSLEIGDIIQLISEG